MKVNFVFVKHFFDFVTVIRPGMKYLQQNVVKTVCYILRKKSVQVIPFIVFRFSVKVTKNKKISCPICLFSVLKIRILPKNDSIVDGSKWITKQPCQVLPESNSFSPEVGHKTPTKDTSGFQPQGRREVWTSSEKGEGSKGQLISKANFLVLIWTKNRTKLFFWFLP